MNRHLLSLFVLAGFVVALFVTLVADDVAAGDKAKKKTTTSASDSANPFGKPEQFGKGKKAMTAIWYDGDQWHLRVTNKKGNKDLFTGSVAIDKGAMIGNFGTLEKNKNLFLADWVFPYKSGLGFNYRFTNTGGADTVSFKVNAQATELSLDFLIDGARYPDRVLVGKAGTSPASLPFKLPAHPTK